MLTEMQDIQRPEGITIERPRSHLVFGKNVHGHDKRTTMPLHMFGGGEYVWSWSWWWWGWVTMVMEEEGIGDDEGDGCVCGWAVEP